MKKYLPEILAVVLICLAVLVLVYQRVATSCTIWFHVSDIMSYEVAASFCVVAAIAVVISKYLGRFK